MEGRGPRSEGGHRERERAYGGPGAGGTDAGRAEAALVRIRDLDGRPRGVGFLADHEGTLLTSHESVDGLSRLVLHVPGDGTHGDRTCVVPVEAVTPLPALGLALVRTEGLGADPLPLSVRERIPAGTYVRVAAGCWREARVLAATEVTYTATDGFHLLDDALELAIGTAGRDALRPGGGAAGGPVLDARTGAVLGVLGTALHTAERDAGFAVPLRPADGALAALLARNAATVPAYGADLNLAGILQLAATSVGQDGPPGALEPLERSGVTRELAAFTSGDRPVLGLVGAPGSGRTTELAALAARRARGEHPAPTLWLRGADLKDTDDSLADAARRALERAARIVAASRRVQPEDLGALTPEHLAHLAARAGRPLLLLLDAPEEMPPALARRLPAWARATTTWLSETGTRLAVACREEHWERAGSAFPEHLLHIPDAPATPADNGTGPKHTPTGPDSAAAGACPADGPGVLAGPGSGAEGHGRGEAYGGSAGSAVSVGSGVEVTRAPVGSHSPAVGACTDRGPGALVAPVATPADGDVPMCTPVGGPGRGPAGPVDSANAGCPVRPAADSASSASSSASSSAEGRGPGRVPVAVPVPGLARPAAVHGGPSGGPPDAPPPTPAPRTPGDALPPCLRIGDFTADEARRAREWYGIPEGMLGDRDARHPLALRLLGEVRAAVPDAPVAGTLGRDDVFAAYLDLMCLRIAVRLAATGGLRGTAVRRLAARVAGQVHEAARRSLGPGQGQLDRESFEALFPWGLAPARLGGGTGWASAVLTEGLLVPAGGGYRFAHEELADWIQGMHLDLDEALRALVLHPGEPCGAGRPVPVPHHRVGPVVQALLLLARQHGPRQLCLRLRELVEALDRDTGSWWAARLLACTLLQVPDATPYTEVLCLLADRVVAWHRAGRPVPADFRPVFWTALSVSDTERLELLRRLVLADPAPPTAGDRYLDAVAGLLAAAPAVVQPLLTGWFADEQPLPATPHATVATAAQALLHTHRHAALDDLVEALVTCAHRRADELLAVLAEEEPPAVCRAVDRWAHDERPARRVAAVTFGLRAAPHARSDADRALLRYAALTLLARPADRTLHGGALALLVRDPHTRDRFLPAALRHFADGDPQLPPSALLPALITHPEPVLEAFQDRLRAPDAGGPDTAAALRRLAEATTPALARRVAALLQEAVRLRPETAGPLAGDIGRRLAEGPTARPVLLPLVTGLLDGGPEPLRAALATVLAAPGTAASRPLRRELLEALLAGEQAPAVLEAVLHAAVERGTAREEPGKEDAGAESREEAGEDDARAEAGEAEVRGLVHRTGLLLVRTPEGATRFDRALVDLGRHVPGFAARMARWLTDAPDDWAVVVGPSTRRMIENLAGVRVPA
ncbi:hypothetical protein [Streptomyces cinerochromogenes]|uniref:hypothetical protein n=1 Tax=Streptomyces cinerochromogenes TaxID=66422 RepID=UPI00339E2F5D